MDTLWEIRNDRWRQEHEGHCESCQYSRKYYMNGNEKTIGTYCDNCESEKYGEDAFGGCSEWSGK